MSALLDNCMLCKRVTRKHWPRPRTPTTDRVCGLPMDRHTDYPYGPPLQTTSQNRMKIRNKYFTNGLSNRLLVSAKFRTLQCADVTFLGSGLSASYIITHCHFLCCGHTVYEWLGSLQEASRKPWNLCSLPCAILFSPFSRGFVNSFQAS